MAHAQTAAVEFMLSVPSGLRVLRHRDAHTRWKPPVSHHACRRWIGFDYNRVHDFAAKGKQRFASANAVATDGVRRRPSIALTAAREIPVRSANSAWDHP